MAASLMVTPSKRRYPASRQGRNTRYGPPLARRGAIFIGLLGSATMWNRLARCAAASLLAAAVGCNFGTSSSEENDAGFDVTTSFDAPAGHDSPVTHDAAA